MNDGDDKLVLSRALASLSPGDRDAVVRAYYRGESVAEIAAHQRIPESVVRSRLHYGLRALRIALQEREILQ